MTTKQKQFILKELIPFILREQGRGFVMATWRINVVGEYESPDTGKLTLAPKCGTVCCIGGSIQTLANLKSDRDAIVGKVIGLSERRAQALFYKWGSFHGGIDAWPVSFAKRFAHAKTPLDKAKVAVALLKEVVRTEGACLDG